MAKWLITIGIICVVLGIAWPLLNKLGFGRLPGDIRIETDWNVDDTARFEPARLADR